MAKDICNATERDKGRMFICALPLHHEEPKHDDLAGHQWDPMPTTPDGTGWVL